MADFATIVELMKRKHGVRVRRWRTNMSGCAWQVVYGNRRIVRWIEAPYPKSAISLSIFLHEVGHHAVGFDRFKRRCEEEFYVWKWAMAEMELLGIQPDAKVLRRFERSMRYAVGKAIRRGIKTLPEPLHIFAPQAA